MGSMGSSGFSPICDQQVQETLDLVDAKSNNPAYLYTFNEHLVTVNEVLRQVFAASLGIGPTGKPVGRRQTSGSFGKTRSCWGNWGKSFDDAPASGYPK